MVRSLHLVMRAILRAPYPWLVRSRSCSVPGGSGSAGGAARRFRRGAGAPGGGCWKPDVVGAGGEPRGDGADGQQPAGHLGRAGRRLAFRGATHGFTELVKF